MSQHNVWHGDVGVRSAEDYITPQELPAVAGCAQQAGRDDSSPASSEECFVQALRVQRARGTGERAKKGEEGKKEALFGEQTGYLRSGVQASVMPKATGTQENLQQ